MATPAEGNKEDPMETRSMTSGSLRSSRLTSSSVAAARARAKAEAAQVEFSFAQKEADVLKKQAEQLKKKAELDADLHVLKSEKVAAAAQAEAQAWEDSATAPAGRDATYESNPTPSRVCAATCRIKR